MDLSRLRVVIDGTNTAAIAAIRGTETGIRGLVSSSSTAGGAIGRALSGAASMARSAFDAAFSAVRGAATATATVVGGLFATSLTKGMSRLTAIDDARGKLRGLGHDAEAIEAIMGSALDAVRGTAFGLGDAATAAAGAVAAGITPGKQLTQYLTTVGDAATIAGVGLDEMASIFGKVTTSGRAYTAELNQLADRGLPIFQWLQDEYKVSAEELRKMVSEGKVDAETFRRVIDENIGGAALESGNTFRGAIANIGASMGRMGATILEPFFEAVKDVAPSLITLFDDLGERIAPVVERWAKSDGFARVVDWLIDIPHKVGPVLDKLGEFRNVVGGLGGAFAALGLGGVRSLLGPLGKLIPAINPIVGAIVGLIAASPELRGLLIDIAKKVIEFAGALDEYLAPVMEVIVSVVDTVAGALRNLLSGGLGGDLDKARAQATGSLAKIAAGFSGFLATVRGTVDSVRRLISTVVEVVTRWVNDNREQLNRIGEKFGEIVDKVRTILQGLIEYVGVIVDYLRVAWELFGDDILSVVATVFETIVDVISAALDVIGGIIDVVLGVLTGDWGRAWDGIKAIVGGAWDAIIAILSGAADLIFTIVGTLISGLWDAFTNFLGWLVDTVGSAIGNVIEFFVLLPVRILEAIGDAALWLVETGWDIITGLLEGIWDKVRAVWDWFTDLPGVIANFFVDAGKWLYDAGYDTVAGFLEGITDKAKDLPGTIGRFLVNPVGGLISTGLSIFSPSRVTWALGEHVTEGFAAGIAAQAPMLEATMQDIVDIAALRDDTDGSILTRIAAGPGLPVPGPTSGGSAPSVTMITEIHVDATTAKDGQDIAEQIRKALDDRDRDLVRSLRAL